MRAYSHDVWRTLRSPGVLVVLGLVAAVGLAPTLLFGAGDLSGPSSLSWGYSEDGSGYQIVAYAYSAVGNPVAGITIRLTAYAGYPGPSPLGGPALYANASTDSGGLAGFSLPPSANGDFVMLEWAGRNGAVAESSGTLLTLGPGSPGLGSGNLALVDHGLFPASPALQVMLVGSSGGVPPPYLVRVAHSASPTLPPSANFSEIGVLSGYVSGFPLPTSSNAPSEPYLFVQVVDPNGSVVVSNYFPSASGPEELAVGAPIFLALSILGGTLAPLLGLFAAYSTYARDRLTGILENVLVRPVTRGGLVGSRFLALAIALAVGVAILTGVLQLVLLVTAGAAFGLEVMLAFYGGVLVVALFFAGVTFFIAHLVRSPGALLASLVTLYLLLGVLWLIVASVVGAFGASVFNPLQYLFALSLTVLALNSSNGLTAFAPPGLLAGLGALWVLLPIAGTWALARRRD